MPTAVIIILAIIAGISLIGGLFFEPINRFGTVLLAIVFIIYALICKQQLLQALADNERRFCIIYVVVFVAVGVLFMSPFFIPGIDRGSFSIGNILVEIDDYRASLGFILIGGIGGGLVSGLFLGLFVNNGLFILFLLPAIIYAVVSLIYGIILVVWK